MKLRNRKSLVTNLPEGEAPQARSFRITQWLYFMLLGAIVVYLLFVLVERFLFLGVRGQIEVQKTVLSAAYGGVIGRLPVQAGQTVAAGELLAELKAVKQCGDEPDSRLQKLEFEIRLNTGRRALYENQLRQARRAVERFSLRRALELDARSGGEERELRREVDDLAARASLLQSELEVQRVAVEELRGFEVPDDPGCRPEQIVAPFAGRVVTVRARTHEFLERGEPLLTLEGSDAAVRVEAFDDPDNLRHWALGRQVEVILPNQTVTLGLVGALQSSARPVPRRALVDYIPVETRTRVHLVPLNDADASVWRLNDRMEVEVRMKR